MDMFKFCHFILFIKLYLETNTCADIDECSRAIASCPPNAACVNIAGSYQCTCETGFQQNGILAPGI